MRNRFPAHCVDCGRYCSIGEGEATKSQFGKWRVQHVRCAAEGAAAKTGATALSPHRDTIELSTRRRNYVGMNPW